MAARHDLIGECGTEWEEVFWGDIPTDLQCKCGNPECKVELSFNWGRANNQANAYLPGTIYFEDANGKVMLASHTNAPTPPGYVRREAQLLSDVRKLEKRLQSQHREQSDRYRSRAQEVGDMQDRFMNRQASYYTDELREIRKTDGYRERMQSLPRSMREMDHDAAAKAVAIEIRRLQNQRASNFTSVDGGVHIDVLHNDEYKKHRE